MDTTPQDNSSGTTVYRYCLRSNGRFHHLVTVNAVTGPGVDIAAVSPLLLRGPYVAYVNQFSDHESEGIPEGLETDVVNVVSGRMLVVPDPEPRYVSGFYSAGLGQSLVLSSSGVVAATGTIYSHSSTAGTFSAVRQYVVGFQASTAQSVALASGAPGTLGNLRIFQCAAGCSSAPAVVGWTSDGAAQYAALPQAG